MFRVMQDVVAAVEGTKNILNPSSHDPAIPMCTYFYIKGMRNNGCGKAGDHLPNSDSKDAPILAW